MAKTGDDFFRDRIEKIFREKELILDIGGGLRIDPEKNNRAKENKWLDPYLVNVRYRVLDKVPDYRPDIVGDIHHLPLEDDSFDAVICISVLEHVEEPQQAMKEVRRVLKPGGYCFLYVPFLYYYHPMKGYYGDFYRFTRDGVRHLVKDFREVEMQNVRGAIATVAHLVPFAGRFEWPFRALDRIFGKERSGQTSGYHVFCVK
ncbi:MAG: type 11 methyltransferase [Parcubacteria group bacterium Gr01-1014_106]|nr:MAG: type 11 methyltransferase [Parcubacteria group bacterium Gr01-1014_106]